VPGVLVGLAATLRLNGKTGTRTVEAGDFFLGGFATALQSGELLTEVVIPAAREGSAFGYYKFKLSESSWPIATATCVVGAGGEVVRLTLGGVSSKPIVVSSAEGAAEAGDVEAAVADTEFEPWGDVLAEGSYRRRIASVVAKRAFLVATAE